MKQNGLLRGMDEAGKKRWSARKIYDPNFHTEIIRRVIRQNEIAMKPTISQPQTSNEEERKDNEQYSKNFTRTPNIVFVAYNDLSKEEKFLYIDLRRVYWDMKPRFVSLRELSELVPYSTGSLSKMLPRLHDAGLIHAEVRREKARNGREKGNSKYHITIVDIWEINKLFFSCSPNEQTMLSKVPSAQLVHEIEQACSRNEQVERPTPPNAQPVREMNNPVQDTNKLVREMNNPVSFGEQDRAVNAPHNARHGHPKDTLKDTSQDTFKEEGTDGSANALPTPALVSHPEYGFLWFDDPLAPSLMVVRLTPEYPHPYHSPDEDKRRERIAGWEVEPYLKARGLNVSVIFMHDLGTETTVEATPAHSPIATDTPTHVSQEEAMISPAITVGSIIIRKDDPDERRQGKVQAIDGTQALVLWFGTRVPHWSSLDEMILFSEWLETHQTFAPTHTGIPGRKPYPKHHSPTEGTNDTHHHGTEDRSTPSHPARGMDDSAHSVHGTTGTPASSIQAPDARVRSHAPEATRDTTSEQVTDSNGYENTDEDTVKTPVVKRDAQQLSTLQASSAQASGKVSAHVEPKAEQDALIARPAVPEMPLQSARWCAETAVLVSESLRGKYYTEGQRQNQVNAARRMFHDFKDITRPQFEEIFRDWATWWRNHDMGLFTLAGLLARGKDREVRLQTALDKLEARASKSQQQPRGTVSGRGRLDAKPTNDNHMLYSDEELREQSDIVWARMQARLASPEVQAKLAAKGIYQ